MAARQVPGTGSSNQSTSFPTSRYIHLNVGGKIYMTSQDTLTRYQDSMLGNMFLQENIPLARDDQGRFLIDRDGEAFRYILIFLRDGELNLPEESREYNQLLSEARFYGLDELVTRMCIHLNVNGVHYSTTRTVLTRHEGSLLAELFNKNTCIDLPRDEAGRYMIRSNGHLFQYILHFLEDNELHLPEKFNKFAELEEEAERYKLDTMKGALIVRLNVGGCDYTATRATLSKERGSLLEEMFTQTPIPLNRDETGRCVIQRDGNLFQYILNYLKDGDPAIPAGTCYCHEFENELDYYRVEGIKPLIKLKVYAHGKYYTVAWKDLTKYKGSLLEVKFAETKIGRESSVRFPRQHYSDAFRYIINFLETGDLAGIPPSEYQNVLDLAIDLSLDELQRQLIQ